MKWISVKDKLPPTEKNGWSPPVLFYDSGGIKLGNYSNESKSFHSCDDQDTTDFGTESHWMPLPDKPKDGE